MKIYTRTGDAGTTGLFGGGRVEKDSVRVEAYGAVDELNASLGVARRSVDPDVADVGDRIESIQNDLFALGAELATVPGQEARLTIPRLAATDIGRLESWIDELELTLPELKNFVLPGGCAAGAQLHEARTTCRRAERRVVTAGREAPVRTELVIYLNRLSDLLFVLARYVNHRAGLPETTWNPRGRSNAQGR
jgi:cob(I)alamin adenosyltransferase